MTEIIALIIHKGGEGKTTQAVTFAAGLALQNKRVVVIDCDAQASLTELFGFDPKPHTYDFMVRGANRNDVLQRVSPSRYAPPKAEAVGELYLMAGNAELSSVTSYVADEYALQERLVELEDWADYIIIDTPSSISLIHTLVYAAITAAICPCKPETMSVKALARTLAHIRKSGGMRAQIGLPPIRILGIIPNNVTDANLHTLTLEQLSIDYPGMIGPVVKQRIAWGEASQLRQSIFTARGNTQAAQEAWEVVSYATEQISV